MKRHATYAVSFFLFVVALARSSFTRRLTPVVWCAVSMVSWTSVLAAEQNYTALLSCSSPGGNIPYYSCMEKMKLRLGGVVNKYEVHQLTDGEFGQGDKLVVPLSERFEIRIRNTAQSDGVYLEVTIEDRGGNVIFQDHAARHEVIAVGN